MMLVEDQLSEMYRTWEEDNRQKTCEAGKKLARKQQQLEIERLARAHMRKEKAEQRAKEIAKQKEEEDKRRQATEAVRETGPQIRQFMLIEASDITMGVILSHDESRLENSHAGIIKRMDKIMDEPKEPD